MKRSYVACFVAILVSLWFSLPARLDARQRVKLHSSRPEVTAQSVKASETRTGKELRALYEQLLRASKQKDEKTLRRILTDDYLQVTAEGRIRSKQDRINETLDPKDQTLMLSLEDFRLRVYANAAIALCKVRQEGTADGKDYKANILSIVTFIRQ